MANSASGHIHPVSGEIDLMKYTDSVPPLDLLGRFVASEQDVKGLLWLSRVKFK
jgi:hypothetical protein